MCIGDVNLRCTILFEDKIDCLIALDARLHPPERIELVLRRRNSLALHQSSRGKVHPR